MEKVCTGHSIILRYDYVTRASQLTAMSIAESVLTPRAEASVDPRALRRAETNEAFMLRRQVELQLEHCRFQELSLDIGYVGCERQIGVW